MGIGAALGVAPFAQVALFVAAGRVLLTTGGASDIGCDWLWADDMCSGTGGADKSRGPPAPSDFLNHEEVFVDNVWPESGESFTKVEALRPRALDTALLGRRGS